MTLWAIDDRRVALKESVVAPDVIGFYEGFGYELLSSDLMRKRL